jgi:hypothetical protein
MGPVCAGDAAATAEASAELRHFGGASGYGEERSERKTGAVEHRWEGARMVSLGPSARKPSWGS